MEAKPIVAELRELLGEDVLLLHCRRGTKRPGVNWKKLRIVAMSYPEYLAKLGTGNIGVVLGARSVGLCSLDIDSDADHEEFLSLNSEIANTLQSKGARGANLWWRMIGAYPRLKVLTKGGNKWGEWRADGGQTMIWGRHPSGCHYRFLRRAKPRHITYESIRWPDGVLPPCMEPELSVTERSERTEPPERTEADRSGVGGACVVHPILDFKDAVRSALPTGAHQNHARLFTLARAVKKMEAIRGSALDDSELRAVFEDWHLQSQPYLRAEQLRDDYYFEFLEAYENAMHPLGINPVDVAWEKAKSVLPPPEAMQFESQHLRLLVSLCRELARVQGSRPFFLSCRTVQKLLGLDSHVQANRWLNGLRRARLLDVTDQGVPGGRRATRFLYKGRV